jgi:hypothetical protein
MRLKYRLTERYYA